MYLNLDKNLKSAWHIADIQKVGSVVIIMIFPCSNHISPSSVHSVVAVLFKLVCAYESTGEVKKDRLLPPPQESNLVGLGLGLRICIYNKLPSNAAGPQTTL